MRHDRHGEPTKGDRMGILSQEQIALLTDYDPTTQYSIAYHTAYNAIFFSWDKKQAK